MQDAKHFVEHNTALKAPPLVPEIRLHLADDALPLWQKTEDELAEVGLPPPFWAFAWAGGQALARHILDHPPIASGARVLDVGAGGGIAAIAAALTGAATVDANDIDRFALAAIALNAAVNEVPVTPRAGDLLAGATTATLVLVLVGDLFYERGLAERTLAFMRRAADGGALLLIGDPDRTYLPKAALRPIAHYAVPTPIALEDTDLKRTTVWTLA